MKPSDGVTHRPTARLSTTAAPSWVQLLVLGPAMFGVTDGCLRRSATADTRTTPMPLHTTTTPAPSHRFPCDQEEYSRAQCLNGGTCYAVMIQHKRHAICNCPAEWAGRRCEEGYIDPDILGLTEDNMRTASIAAGVSVCILVIFVLLLAVYVYLRYKRKQRLLSDREFEATAEELYRRPFSGRSSIVESSSRPGSIRRGKKIPSLKPSPKKFKFGKWGHSTASF